MGMAASQARYLELTARKSNVEFQGQQINQQRTELSNESAGLFNQLLALNVPTAPSSSDYTQTIYSFSDGANNCTITNIDNLNGDPDYNKKITYYYTETIPKGIGNTRTDLGVSNLGTDTTPIYWLTDGASKTTKNKLTQCTSSDKNVTTETDSLLQICADNPTCQLAKDIGYDSKNKTITDISKAYMYTNTNGLTYYYSSTNLSDAATHEGAAVSLTGYYSSTIDNKVYKNSNAYMQTTDTGRYSNITLKDYTSSFDLTATSTTNTAAYNDAVNEYEYQQEVYQQEMNNLNARTSVVQQEDKTLELQLRQLDTEQQALQTEMESVKKVIDKNIESTFKTFSS